MDDEPKPKKTPWWVDAWLIREGEHNEENEDTQPESECGG